MKIVSKTLDMTLALTSAAGAAWMGTEFFTGFGFGANNFLTQAGLAAGASAAAFLAEESFHSFFNGVGTIPQRLFWKYNTRPFARNLIGNVVNITQTTPPKMTSRPSMMEMRNKHTGFMGDDFSQAHEHYLEETIEHDGKIIKIKHHENGSHSVTVMVPDQEGPPLFEELNTEEASLLIFRLEKFRTKEFAKTFQCKADIDTIAAHVALRLPQRTLHHGTYLLDEDPNGHSFVHMIHRENKERTCRGWLMHPSIGYLQIPMEIVEEIRKSRREQLLLSAFDQTIESPLNLPPIIGNPAAAKEVSVARKLIERYPDMRDAAGVPIAPLIKEHLPRLLRAHTEATAAATATDDIDEKQLKLIAAEFEEGLAVITRAILEGVEAEQQKKQDDLSVEIAFLRARHPSPSLLSVA